MLAQEPELDEKKTVREIVEEGAQEVVDALNEYNKINYFLDNVAGWILELDRGQGIPWKGNYASWLEQKKNSFQNVLLLDEPTNDLDVNTMRALKEALENFAGLRLRVTARWSGSRETTLNMRQTERPISALPQISHTTSGTGT